MKIVLTFSLFFAALCLTAQPIVLSNKESVKGNLNKKELDKQYPETQEIAFALPSSLSDAVRKAFDKAMGPKKMEMLVISSDLYLNKEGRIDYLIYNARVSMWIIKNGETVTTSLVFNQDSLSRIITQNLPEHLKDFVSKRHAGQKSKLTIYNNFDAISTSGIRSKSRMLHDSIVNGLFGESGKLKGSGKKIERKEHVVKGLHDALSVVDTFKIKELYIENALLTSFPDVIYRFPNLEILSLVDNDIEQVDINMKRLPKLRHLNLSGNILSENAIKISSNKTLKLLNLQRNIMHDVPIAVMNSRRLKTLWLGRNKLFALTDSSFHGLRRLRDLNLYKSGIDNLPYGIKKMRRLQVLDLYYNNLVTLPASIMKMKRLTHLAIAHNQLTTLPEEINKLKRLKVLYAHHNRLSKLPLRIVKLNNLRILDLGFNSFTNFPAELISFANLTELDLSSNNFTEFPAGLLALKRLNKLFLSGNPFLREDKETKYGQQFSQLKRKNIEVFY